MARKQESIFDGTSKLADKAIQAYKAGGMPLVLVVIGMIGFVFSFLFRSTMSGGTFAVMILISVLLFGVGVWIYLKEKKII